MALTTTKDNAFERFNNRMMEIEGSVVAALAATIPWMTPIAPAVMTYRHATETLGFHPIVAFPIAATVEALGFVALYLIVSFVMFNRRNRAKYKAAPTWAAVFAFVFYLAIILVSNVLLDAFQGTVYMPWVIIAVKALFTLMAIPGGIVVVVRAAHRDLLQAVEQERQEARQAKQDDASREQLDTKNRQLASRVEQLVQLVKQQKEQLDASREQLAQLASKKRASSRKPSIKDEELVAYLQSNKDASQQEVADHFGVSREAIRQRVKKLVEKGKLKV